MCGCVGFLYMCVCVYCHSKIYNTVNLVYKFYYIVEGDGEGLGYLRNVQVR